MSEIVNIHDTKTHLFRLIERATSGEEIIIKHAGEPLVSLTQVEPIGPRTPGQSKGPVRPDELFAPVTEGELADWEERTDLPLTLARWLLAGSLPGRNRDPFDRMLIAQSILEEAVLNTADPIFASYNAITPWS